MIEETCRACKFKCSKGIPNWRREKINRDFWLLPTERKDRFLADNIVKIRNGTNSKYKIALNYYLPLNGLRREVCAIFFQNTLNLTRKRITNFINRKSLYKPKSCGEKVKSKENDVNELSNALKSFTDSITSDTLNNENSSDSLIIHIPSSPEMEIDEDMNNEHDIIVNHDSCNSMSDSLEGCEIKGNITQMHVPIHDFVMGPSGLEFTISGEFD